MQHARKDYQHIQDYTRRIGADEPVFLIRAKDLVGPDALNHYASLAETQGAAPALVASVNAHAARMRAWQREHVNEVKVPDAPLEVL